VIAVDTNVLIYAHFSGFPKHRAALGALKRLAEGQARWAIPVFCLAEFIRVSTHPRLFEQPLTSEQAWDAVRKLTESPSLVVLLPSDRFLSLFGEIVAESAVTGNLVFDAQIVALCKEAGARSLLTEDRDYARFSDFQTIRL
jgi:toxin-antitoxin system PIN domain toxin